MTVEQIQASADRWRAHWRSRQVQPPTDAEARLLRETFEPIRPRRQAA